MAHKQSLVGQGRAKIRHADKHQFINFWIGRIHYIFFNNQPAQTMRDDINLVCAGLPADLRYLFCQ